MLVTVLGSGGALPTQRRASSGYLVEWSGGALLLDLAAGTYGRALKAGLDPRRLRAVALSHFHPDHTADLAGLFWGRRQAKIEEPLVVAGPPGTDALVARQRAVYGDWLDIAHEVRAYPCAIAGLTVAAFPARHSEEAVCLRVTADGKTLAYSGDTADCPGLREAAAGADLAILECSSREAKEGHMTPEDCEAVAAAARPRRVLLSHLGPDVSPRLPAAEDGLVICV